MSGQLPGTLDALLGRQWRAERPATPVDRESPRWQRIRAALCPHHGLQIDLDEYADHVASAIPQHSTGATRSTLDGMSAGGPRR